jgi:scyllo-inositol 2-dehydrogenase (NADP+)
MNQESVGVGIIGFGLAARVFHAPFVSAVPGLRLQAFVERSGNESTKLYPETQVFRSVEEMLAAPGIGLVIVATPNTTHFALARQALLAGKHVVIDKPFASSTAEARELIELAVDRGLILAPFHNRRWDGDFLTVRKLLADGTLGRLVTFESHFDRFRPLPREATWKESEDPANGLLFDLGPHLLDQALTLFGMPASITASVRTDRDRSAIEDAFEICLGYPRLLFWARSSMIAAEPSPRFLLHGTLGSFRKWGLDPQEPALVAGASVPPMGSPTPWLPEPREAWGNLTLAPDPAEPANLTHEPLQTIPGDYRHFYASVRDAILGTAPLAVPTLAGLQIIHLLELARQSSNEGRTILVGEPAR